MGFMALTNVSSGPGARPGGGAQPLVIELQGLHKSFGSVEAVKGIDLSITAGEVVAFLGPNGAGKTTTIDMILGLSRPTAGDVSVYGMHPRQAISRGLVSAVMQNGGLLKDLTVEETAQYTASLFAHTRPVDEVLRRAGISDIRERKVGKCSGGEQQRLRFAMALLSDPELLILDEPTTGMDVEGRRGFWAAIRHDTDEGRTVLFATHYLEEADAYADRIILIRHGRDRRGRHVVRGQGHGGRPDGAGHAGGRGRGGAARDTGGGQRGGARRDRADPLHRQRRGRQVPADQHRRPGTWRSSPAALRTPSSP